MATPNPIDEVSREIILSEYNSLRDEILKKMDHRTTYRLATLTLSLTAMGIGIQLRSSALLLIVPMIAMLLGNLSSFQTMQISRLATYIRENIEKPLNGQYGASMGWHISHEDRPARLRESLLVSYIPNVAIPLTPSLVSMVFAWSYSNSLWVTIFLFCIDLALIAYFLSIYVKNRYSL
ncbi:hypothetical protein [Streptomyces europaeiscabiei]|uniref:hypothetical protein n=1 Tax=Streptomyces europaeiscabiei TaxID=146819 RepID=UPI0029B3AA28|nr:hypothetical protein [Streptomyces europaeiscabiei]MDX3588248.1 hypothetical protein [Streptomyces europaeiscabiei]